MTIKVPSNNPHGRPRVYPRGACKPCLSIDRAVIDAVDAYAKAHGISRSRAATLAMRVGINALA